MKVNIISNYKPKTGLMQDVGILRGILTAAFDKDVQIFRVHYMQPQCSDADVNIFMEVISPCLFPYAGRNIWIPNSEWTYNTWIPYLSSIDEVWAKTHECYDLFKEHTPNVKYIGWTSIDKHWIPETDKKNYYKAIVPVGKNIYRHPKPLLQAYKLLMYTKPEIYRKLPTLHIPFSESDIKIFVPEDISSKVVLYPKPLSDNEYNDLLLECGLCVCLSAGEGFCHAVCEAQSAGCNLILSPIRPFLEDLSKEGTLGTLFARKLKQEKHPDCLGTMVDSDVTSVIEALEEYVETDFKTKRIGSQASRETYGANHQSWVDRMKLMLAEMNVPAYELSKALPKEAELPDVSIVTITKDRRIFMPLAKYSYMIQSYPEDKLEWVIVDDGEDSIEDTLIGVPNVKYIRCDSQLTISQKRNLGVKEAMYDVVAFMDDDDVYPNNSVLHRAAMMLKEPKKECSFCTTIPCYDITKYSSFMNVPPMTLKQSMRVSEATLIFTKKFWQERGFDDLVHVGEADAFIRGREQMCRELSPQDVIVSLVHPLNTSSRKMPEMKEPNGNHYGFNEKLFALVSQIGEELKASKSDA